MFRIINGFKSLNRNFNNFWIFLVFLKEKMEMVGLGLFCDYYLFLEWGCLSWMLITISKVTGNFKVLNRLKLLGLYFWKKITKQKIFSYFNFRIFLASRRQGSANNPSDLAMARTMMALVLIFLILNLPRLSLGLYEVNTNSLFNNANHSIHRNACDH